LDHASPCGVARTASTIVCTANGCQCRRAGIAHTWAAAPGCQCTYARPCLSCNQSKRGARAAGGSCVQLQPVLSRTVLGERSFLLVLCDRSCFFSTGPTASCADSHIIQQNVDDQQCIGGGACAAGTLPRGLLALNQLQQSTATFIVIHVHVPRRPYQGWTRNHECVLAHVNSGRHVGESCCGNASSAGNERHFVDLVCIPCFQLPAEAFAARLGCGITSTSCHLRMRTLIALAAALLAASAAARTLRSPPRGAAEPAVYVPSPTDQVLGGDA
jgi:hypothetical protein